MKIRWKPRYVGLSRFCFYPTSCQNTFMASKVLDFLWDFDLIYSPHFTILSVFLILLFYLSIFLPPISFIRSFVHLISFIHSSFISSCLSSVLLSFFPLRSTLHVYWKLQHNIVPVSLIARKLYCCLTAGICTSAVSLRYSVHNVNQSLAYTCILCRLFALPLNGMLGLKTEL